jgi:hypothetical protein
VNGSPDLNVVTAAICQHHRLRALQRHLFSRGSLYWLLRPQDSE